MPEGRWASTVLIVSDDVNAGVSVAEIEMWKVRLMAVAGVGRIDMVFVTGVGTVSPL